MVSNSSRFLCRLRNAAARFLTSRASRLLRPETSGGTKSLVLIRSLGFLETVGTGLGAERLTEEEATEVLIDIERDFKDVAGDGGVGGSCTVAWTSPK